MRTHATVRVVVLSATVVTSLLTLGCATRPPIADRIEASPMGTVTTYHRRSSGSLGNFDGQVVWTHAPGTWQGKPVVAYGAPQGGVALLDPVSSALIATLNPAGQPVASFEPPMDYQWPLEVGKQWSSSTLMSQYPSGRTLSLKTDFKVESWGDVTVPAGTFKAFKLVWTNNLGETETRWVSPAEGIATVKRHVERPASHPQGAGVLDAELLSRTLPSR